MKIRFEISDEINSKLMKIKGSKMKLAFAQELFEKSVDAEFKKLNKNNK